MSNPTNNKTPDEDPGVTELINWLKAQEHLPQCIDKLLLQRFIYSCKGDLKKAKALIDLNYTLRNKNPHVFMNRDPYDKEFNRAMETSDIVILPGTTRDNGKVVFYRIDAGHEKFNYLESVRMFLMFEDVRLITPDPAGICNDITISDLKGMNLTFLRKAGMSLMKTYSNYNQEAHPISPTHIHFINCPPFLHRMIGFMKVLVKKEVMEMMHFHLPDSETLYEFIPKEMLPTELGGSAGTIEAIKKEWSEKVKQKRNYLRDDKYWKVDESKRGKFTRLQERTIQDLCID